MSNLPREDLHNILIQVPFQQRLECMFVCHYWYDTLFNRSLLYDIDINSDEKYEKFSDILERMPRRGSQVEILKLDIDLTFDKRMLCNILPNLRVFDFHHKPSDSSEQIEFSNEPLKLAYPNSKLEKIRDGSQCELTKELLMFGSCSYLRKLDLDLKSFQNPRENIFIHLENAPSLKEFKTVNCGIGIEDFEIIHNNLPGLNTIEFDRVNLLSGKLPRDIIPATSVTDFSLWINEITSNSDHHEWYKYIAKKYTNLKRFVCYDLQILEIDSSETAKIYRDGILPIYKNNGHYFNYFNAMNIPTEVNAFDEFDEFGLQLSEFRLEDNRTRPTFEQLAQSNQSKYAERLIMMYTDIASPNMFQNFTSLTELYIDANEPTGYWNINLTYYLNAFPTTLILFHAYFIDVEVNELPDHPNNIQNLVFGCSILSPKLAEAISGYFPRLNQLCISGELIEPINLNLPPNNHFERLSIQSYYDGEEPHCLSANIADTVTTKYYIEDSSTEYDLEYITEKGLLD